MDLKLNYKKFNIRFFKMLNMRTLAISICFVVLITILMFLYVKVSTAMIEKDITSATLQSIEQVEVNVRYWINYAEQVDNMIFGSSVVQSALKTPVENESLADQFAEMKNLNNFIDNIESNQPITVELYVPDKKFYASDRERFFSMEDCKKRTWYEAMEKYDGRILWISDYTSGLVSCVGIIKDVNNYKHVLGAVRVSMKAEFLQGIIDNINLESGNHLFIINENGLIITDYDTNRIGNKAFSNDFTTKLSAMNKGILRYNDRGIKNSVMFTDIGNLQWKIVASVPANKIIGSKTSIYMVFSFTLIIILIIMFITFVISSFYNSSIHNRIRQIIGKIERDGVKRLTGDTSVKYDGDIDRLQNSVDEMLYTLNDVYVKYYDALDHKRKTEMEVLQAQINPHFLYNTFDMLNWMAIKNNAQDISAMVENLALYFRLSLNKGRNLVTMEDEIKLSQVYMEIQNKRFSNCVKVIMNMPSELKSYLVPKITFQPIIENALIHGIRQELDKHGTITLDARLEGKYIFVEITDDGIGMSAETLCNALSGTHHSDNYVRTGFGLYNVSERLKIFSNDSSCGLSFKSSLGVGTTVTVKFVAEQKI